MPLYSQFALETRPECFSLAVDPGLVKEGRAFYLNDPEVVTCFLSRQESTLLFDREGLRPLLAFCKENPCGKELLKKRSLKIIRAFQKDDDMILGGPYVFMDTYSGELRFLRLPLKQRMTGKDQEALSVLKPLYENGRYLHDGAWRKKLLDDLNSPAFSLTGFENRLLNKKHKGKPDLFFQTVVEHGPAPKINEEKTRMLFDGYSLARLVLPDGSSHDIHDSPFIIGRQPDCMLVLDDGAVSKQHAYIVLENDRHYVVDLGSTNGTYLNTARLTPNKAYPLKDSDRLQLARTVLVYHE